MPVIESGAGTTYYRDDGTPGRTVVLLHEYFATGESWSAQRAWLRRMFRVVIPDLRGHGRSVTTDRRLTVTDMASDTCALLDHLRIGRAHFVGCSIGAIVALHLARTAPERVESIALSSVPDLRDQSARAYARRYITEVFPRVESRLDSMHGTETGYSRNVLLRSFEMDLTEMPADHLDAIRRRSEVEQQTLVLAGDSDSVFSPGKAVQFRDALPNSRLAILPGSGHLVHQDAVTACNQLLLEHLTAATCS